MKYLVKVTVNHGNLNRITYFGRSGERVGQSKLTEKRIERIGYLTEKGAQNSWYYNRYKDMEHCTVSVIPFPVD